MGSNPLDVSFDEILGSIEDAFDASVSPQSIVREDNNKLHLMFKADAAGYQKINDAVLALSQRFNPSLCSEDDLPITAQILGTAQLPGKVSALAITVTNSSATDAGTLLADTYQYVSSSGEIFTFTVLVDTILAAGQSMVFYALSTDVGAFSVSSIASISIAGQGGSALDPDFDFMCSDNTQYLGFPQESLAAFRTRLIAGTNREDIINEIETAMLQIPSIYDCDLVLNASSGSYVYDGITLAPMELLIVLSGVPTEDVALALVKHGYFLTHEVSSDQVVNYENSLLAGGVFPVYYALYGSTNYTATVSYSFDSTKIQQAVVEAALSALLATLGSANVHSDTITQAMLFDLLQNNGIVSVSILGVTLLVGGTAVPYVSVPKTRIGKLTSVGYSHVDVSA